MQPEEGLFGSKLRSWLLDIVEEETDHSFKK